MCVCVYRAFCQSLGLITVTVAQVRFTCSRSILLSMCTSYPGRPPPIYLPDVLANYIPTPTHVISFAFLSLLLFPLLLLLLTLLAFLLSFLSSAGLLRVEHTHAHTHRCTLELFSLSNSPTHNFNTPLPLSATPTTKRPCNHTYIQQYSAINEECNKTSTLPYLISIFSLQLTLYSTYRSLYTQNAFVYTHLLLCL